MPTSVSNNLAPGVLHNAAEITQDLEVAGRVIIGMTAENEVVMTCTAVEVLVIIALGAAVVNNKASITAEVVGGDPDLEALELVDLAEGTMDQSGSPRACAATPGRA